MTYSILTLLATIALMTAMAMTLILKPKALRKFNGCAVFFAGIVGLIFYGLGYGTGIKSPGEMFIVAIQAVSDTISMFTGSDSYGSLMSSAPWFAEHMWMQILYWLAVLAAMYFTAAVVLGTLGKRFLRFLRSNTVRWRQNIVVFYPTNEKQIAMAENICKKNNINPVFVGECKSDKLLEKIDNIGGIVWEDDVIKADGKWMEKLGLKNDEKKVIRLFTAGENDSTTKKFLLKVLDGMEKTGVTPKNLTLTILCEDEQEFSFLTGCQKDDYYIQADICSYKNMTAKMLTKEMAPWKCVEFNENGEVANGFHAMILGFGQMGQSVLCEMIRNSQFIGKKTKIQVVDKQYKEKSGAFLSIYKEMLSYFDIEFVELDVFSEEFFNLLYNEQETVNYIAICMGDEEKNTNAASQIRFFRNRKNGRYYREMVIASCLDDKIVFYDNPDLTIAIPDSDDLWEGTMDDEAKIIDKVYLKSKAISKYPDDLKKQEAFYKECWYKNTYSNRLSCAASASFIPAMYKAAGIGSEEKNPRKIMTQRMKENPALLDTLSQMEHMRWNAFSYSMGVVPMSLTEFKKRVDQAMESIKADVDRLEKASLSVEEGKAAIRRIQDACRYVRKEIDTDGFGGIHVCLSDWDILDQSWNIYYPLASMVAKADYYYALIEWNHSREKKDKPKLENIYDFKQLDVNNIMNLMDENN